MPKLHHLSTNFEEKQVPHEITDLDEHFSLLVVIKKPSLLALD